MTAGFDPAIADAAARFGLPQGLLRSIGIVESGMNPGTGASRLAPAAGGQRGTGMMQLTPATAREMGVDPSDPTAAIYGAARYLRQGLDATGDLDSAVRYYHGGPDRRQWGPRTEAYHAKVLATARSLGDGDAAASQSAAAPRGPNPFLAMAGKRDDGHDPFLAALDAKVAADSQPADHDPFLAALDEAAGIRSTSNPFWTWRAPATAIPAPAAMVAVAPMAAMVRVLFDWVMGYPISQKDVDRAWLGVVLLVVALGFVVVETLRSRREID